MNGRIFTALTMTAIALAGCGKSDTQEAQDTLSKGQVVATVDGQDVTVYELNAELEGAQIPENVPRKQVEQAALQQIVNRKILAAIARERGLDKTPDFLIQQHRAADITLVRLLQRNVAQKVSMVTRDEAANYIKANPNQFAQRKIFQLEQIQFLPSKPDYYRVLEPLNTLDEIEARLKADKVRYRRGTSTVDSLTVTPDQLQKLLALPANAVFVAPANNMLTANRIVATRTEPFTDPRSINYAMNVLQARKLQQAETADLKARVDAARAKVNYQPGYAPPPPPKPAPAAKPGAAPAPAPAAAPPAAAPATAPAPAAPSA